MSKEYFNETEDHYAIDIEVECSNCKGTGLYVGMSERDGAAVVCHTCAGSGKVTFKREFPKFVGRKRRDNVKRVYKSGAGYTISASDVTTKDGKLIRFSQAGSDYDKWLWGAVPKPIEDLHCPYMHTNQNMQLSDHEAHAVYEEYCMAQGLWGCLVSDCKRFENKAECWRRYHELLEAK